MGHDASRTRAGGRPLRIAVAGSVAGKAVEIVTLALLATLVPRELGPADFGRFSVTLTLVTLGSLALTLGGPSLMARFVPAAPAEQRIAVARAIGLRLTRGRAIQVAVIAFGVLCVALVDPAVFDPLHGFLVVAAFALNVATSLALQVALGLGRTVSWSTRFPLQNAVLIAGVLLLYPAWGVTGALVAILVSAMVGVAFATVVAARALSASSGPQPRVELPPGAIRFGRVQAAAAALVQCIQRGGVVAVALLTSAATQVGYAALAIGIVLGITYAILQAFTVSLPHLTEYTTRDGTSDASEAILRRLANIMLAVLLPLTVVAALTIDSLVPVVFGPSYQGAGEVFGPALALLTLAPLSALYTQVSALRVRPSAALWSASAGAIAFVVAAIATIPAWRATGGTAAALVGGLAAVVTSMRVLPGAAGRALVGASLVGCGIVLILMLA